MTKKTKSNMYDWVGMRWNPLGGACPHHCVYCSTNFCRWTRDNPKYKGEPRIIESEMQRKLIDTEGKPIFVCAQNDLFSSTIPFDTVARILMRLHDFPKSQFILQTKNPGKYQTYMELFPPNTIFGTTIETNRQTIAFSEAPLPSTRAMFMGQLKHIFENELDTIIETFVTIEPIMDFDIDKFLDLIDEAEPNFINIGADSKYFKLPEPKWKDVEELMMSIRGRGIEIREKSNLERLKK